ncbi:MAG: MFS transporter [Planctomycetota bacterium]
MCADGAAWSVMVGIGETYLPAFVLALSQSELACGLIATVPMISGAILQLVSPYAVRRLGSYRLWVVLCALVQAAAFVPLVVGGLAGTLPLAVVFVAASVYWGAGLATGPAWNAWVEALVPRRLRARFFARRTRLSQFGLLGGFVIGGLVLQAGTKLDTPLAAFALLFFVAAVSRLVSARYLGSQREPLPPGNGLRGLGVRELASSVRKNASARLLLFMLATQMAVSVAGPYFTPYMFVHLGLSYSGFVVLVCAASLAKILFLPAVGRIVQRWGANRILWMSGMIIAPIPALWLLYDGFAYLLVLQVLAGTAWAAYELAMLLLFFETIPNSKRLSILTVFNLAYALAIVAGSVVGGLILVTLGASREAYLAIFAASTIARAAALLLLVRMPKITLGSLLIATRSIALRPSMGTMDRPVLPSLNENQETCHRREHAETSTGDTPLHMVG